MTPTEPSLVDKSSSFEMVETDEEGGSGYVDETGDVGMRTLDPVVYSLMMGTAVEVDSTSPSYVGLSTPLSDSAMRLWLARRLLPPALLLPSFPWMREDTPPLFDWRAHGVTPIEDPSSVLSSSELVCMWEF